MKPRFTKRQLLKLFLPLLVEQLLVMLVGMIDTVMISSAGEAAISGVSIVNDVNNLMIQLMAALASGGAVVVSQFYGFKDERNTKKSASQLMMISCLFSLSIAVFIIFFHRGILNVLYGSVESRVMEAAVTYFFITAISFPFLGAYNAATALYRSMNKTNTTMYVSILMNTLNVVGNYFGVFVLKMGVAGVAWPTLFSRMVAALIMVNLSLDKQNAIHIEIPFVVHWDSDIIRRLLRIAVPNGMESGLFQLGKVLISSMIATYGTSQIAANGVVNSLGTLSYTTELALQLGVITIIGQCVGANDYEQASYYIKRMVLLGSVTAIMNTFLVYLFMPVGLRFYSLSGETYALAAKVMTMDCIAIGLLHSPAFVLPTCMRAAGDAKYTMLVGVLSMFFARVGCSLLFGTVLGMGLVGVKIGWYIDWVVRIIFFAIRFFSGKWKNYRVVS